MSALSECFLFFSSFFFFFFFFQPTFAFSVSTVNLCLVSIFREVTSVPQSFSHRVRLQPSGCSHRQKHQQHREAGDYDWQCLKRGKGKYVMWFFFFFLSMDIRGISILRKMIKNEKNIIFTILRYYSTFNSSMEALSLV